MKPNRRGDPTRDEYFTPAAMVAALLGPYGDDWWAGRRVLCPCDGTDSEYVRYLRARGAEVTFGGRFEDYNFRDFGFVATNPPFSRWSDFLGKILDSGVPFNVLAPSTACDSPRLRALLGGSGPSTETGQRGSVGVWTCPAPTKFRRPDGTLEDAPCLVVASRPYPGPSRQRREFAEDGTEVFRTSASVPDWWEGEILVPVTFPVTRPWGYEVTGSERPRVDGTVRFRRLRVRCVPRDGERPA